MEHLDTAIVLIPLLAVIAPLAARAIGPWLRVPVVVFELALGIVVGPSVLGWVGPSAFVDVLSEFGLAMLFFVAGTEIELRRSASAPGAAPSADGSSRSRWESRWVCSWRPDSVPS